MALDLKAAIEKYGEQTERNPQAPISVSGWCGLDDGTGIYANDDKIKNEVILAELNEMKDYRVKSWENIKGKFKVYNIPLINDLQLIYANSVVMGAGQVFGTTG